MILKYKLFENIDEYLVDENNKFIVTIGEDDVIGATDDLKEAFIKVLMPRISNTESEEIIFKEAVDDILAELSESYTQEELTNNIDELINELGKEAIYDIKLRSNLI